MNTGMASKDEAKRTLLNQLRTTAETYGWHESIGSEFILWEQLTAEDNQLPPETIKQITETTSFASSDGGQ
jgi:hypothetical protein